MSSRARLAALVLAGLFGVLVVAAYLTTTPSDTYVLAPDDSPHLADSAVAVQGERKETGAKAEDGIMYLVVKVHRASLAESWLAHFERDSTVLDANAVLPPGGNETDDRRRSRLDIDESKDIAAAVALRAAGYKVDVKLDGVIVETVGAPSARKAGLGAGMVITAVNGTPTRTLEALRRELAKKKAGDKVTVAARDGSKRRTFRVTLIKDPETGRPLLGISATPLLTIGKLPIDVDIETGNIGGPSAGLAFALEIYDEVKGGTLTGDTKIAVTGTIDPEGRVGPIGGMKQKAIGARHAGAQLLVVPDENAAEARANAGDLPVVA